MPTLHPASHPARVASCLALVLLPALFVAPTPARAAAVPQGFRDSLVVAGLDRPVGIAFLPGSTRLLVVEQKSAYLKLVSQGTVPYSVRIPGVFPNGNEQGLLGVAVHPGWPAAPYVYLQMTDSTERQVRITRYQATGDLAGAGDGLIALDLESQRDVLVGLPDTAPNHNGGTVRFGPDGMLYSSLGDDGGDCVAQDVTSRRGQILRLDVDALPAGAGAAPAPETLAPADNPFIAHPDPYARLVWAHGLRNPFRFHIDHDGALFVGDVGLDTWEEIDHIPAGGLNLGWPHYEGADTHDTGCAIVGSATFPIHAYTRAVGMSASVISAGIYRHVPGNPSSFGAFYDGDYFFSDNYGGFLRRLKRSGDTWSLAPPVLGQPADLDFGQGFAYVTDYLFGPEGGLWYCRLAGQIRVILGSDFTPPTAAEAPAGAGLSFAPAVPNPARSGVRLSFTLAAAAEAELALFDLGGRRVRTLLPAGTLAAGAHQRVWDGADDAGRALPAGLYFARLRSGETALERRIVLAR